MKKALLLALVLAVIPVGVDAQAPDLEQWRARSELGYASAQYFLGTMYATGRGVPEDDVKAVRLYRLAAEQGFAGAPKSKVSIRGDR
jgi:TPR repeat protein